MNTIRILFTGIGRRVELVQAFRKAALVLNKKLIVYGADMSKTAPALAYCDYSRFICGMKEEGYIPQLLNICESDKIDLIIPTIDTDLQVLADNKNRFESIGTRVLVSNSDMIAICRDKNRTYDFFIECGLNAPISFNEGKKYIGSFPAFIKPKDGSSSINTHKIHNEEELKFYASRIEDYIIQPFIKGEEFTIDAFCDFNGKIISIVPRKRLAVRAGEVLKTKICLDSTIIREVEDIIRRFKPCGPLTIQLIREQDSNKNYYIEINPRYGGGSPLSMKAGARTAEAVLQMLCGQNVAPYVGTDINNNTIFSRYDQSICIDEGEDISRIRGVIFDLDDTLYNEKEYVRSGYKQVAEYLGKPDLWKELWNEYLNNNAAIDEVLTKLGRETEKEKCIRIYREHMPDIYLNEEIKGLLKDLRAQGIKIGVITDGRVEGQKNKIKALGIESLIDDIIITDELGGEQFRKPNDISFRIMQTRWKLNFEDMVYVGDNLSKDFQAPICLGMKAIYYKNKEGIYYTDSGDEYKCTCIVNNVGEMRQVLDVRE